MSQYFRRGTLARIIHETDYCDASRPASAAFRSVTNPQRTVKYACGSFGRETPQLLVLAASRHIDS